VLHHVVNADDHHEGVVGVGWLAGAGPDRRAIGVTSTLPSRQSRSPPPARIWIR